MKMKDYTPKYHPQYSETFDDSAWKKINDSIENLSTEEFQAIIKEDCQKALKECKRNLKNK